MKKSRGAPEPSGARYYQELLALTHEMVWVVDAAGTVRYAGPASQRVMGYSPETLVGSPALAHVHPEDAAAVREAFARAVAAEGKAVSVTFRCRHAGGSYRVLEATGQSRLSDGILNGLVVSARDVTEQAQAEEEHRALLEHIHASLAALASLAGDLTRIDGNVAADDHHGLTESVLRLAREAIGAHAVAVTLIDAGGACRTGACSGLTPAQEQEWRSGRPGTTLREHMTAEDHERLRTDGVLVLDLDGDPPRRLPCGVQTALLAVLSAGSRIAGVLALDLGAAHRRLSEEDLLLARAAASLVALAVERDRLVRECAATAAEELAMRETGRRMEAFLALAAHELRTPLAASSGNVQIALRRLDLEANRGTPVPGDLKIVLTRAQRALDRLNLLINDVLDVARPQAEQLIVHRERCDLAVVVREAAEELSALAPDRVHMDLAPGPLLCDADTARISQVVHNYLTNALKYAPEGSPIEIGVRPVGGVARVWVRDHGPGIPAEDQARVWERFYRVDGIAHQPGTRPGLGLGLYISKTIVEQHGGEVGVESAIGGGSTFWFTIPLAN